MNAIIRKSTLYDLQDLCDLEMKSFPVHLRSSKRAIQLSLQSHFQEVWLAEKKIKGKKVMAGSMTLFKYKKAIRIYSIAILSEMQGQGIGSALIGHACNLALSMQCSKVILEVDANNNSLIKWYNKKGFDKVGFIKDYYAEGFDCIKMEFDIAKREITLEDKNIIVVNNPRDWDFNEVNARVISVNDYIHKWEYQNDKRIRIFNLCQSYKYQSQGYYISLLAAARGQRIIPSATTIKDFGNIEIIRSITTELDDLIQNVLNGKKEKSMNIHVFFGQTSVHGYKKLASKLFQLFELPFFSVSFSKNTKWYIKSIHALNHQKIPKEDRNRIQLYAKEYFSKKRFKKATLKTYLYDLAILINPYEKTPPSCPVALRKFKEAANKVGFYCEFITREETDKINEFDALFIRETTGVNDHTYSLSRLAYAEGLVVIDDPWSIIRCSNKIYQYELFKANNILTPHTEIFAKSNFSQKDLKNISFPVVVKQPDSSFSLGVSKVNSSQELIQTVKKIFINSDMVICQEFMYSDYDWRIGVIDNTPLYACKYYMSEGHWQIYNWSSGQSDSSGNFETLPVENVPKAVINVALKAASLIGDGLYGIDLKVVGGKVFVIEVNDNPNLDAGVEDFVIRDQLYETIMRSFYTRIDLNRNIKRYISD